MEAALQFILYGLWRLGYKLLYNIHGFSKPVGVRTTGDYMRVNA
jgi:hypothetical protein